jgi:Alkaline phosphatase PhoX
MLCPFRAGRPTGPTPRWPAAPHRLGRPDTPSPSTVTEEYMPIPGMGRHNHENQVLVPGGWDELAFLSGDDTFTAPGSQLYMYLADDATAVLKDNGHLFALQIDSVDGAHVLRKDPFNGANDYLDLSAGESFGGRFIKVPDPIADGTINDPLTPTGDMPQNALESWSNENNVFQFIRVEDIAYDPDNPRVVYFADTGATVQPSAATGRMIAGGTGQRGRVFKMVLNATDPKIVDSLTILADGNNSSSAFNRPDNIAVGDDTIMIQEDATNSRVWMYTLSAATPTWTAVAKVDSVPADTAIADPGESSGIIDMSAWLGAGWWALDVQAHQDANQDVTQVHVDQFVNPTYFTWAGGPIPPGPVIPPGGNQYRFHREKGQLLFMFVPGS